jgi:hypothetical protein
MSTVDFTVFFQFFENRTNRHEPKDLLEEEQALPLPKEDCVTPLFKSCWLFSPHKSSFVSLEQ